MKKWNGGSRLKTHSKKTLSKFCVDPKYAVKFEFLCLGPGYSDIFDGRFDKKGVVLKFTGTENLFKNATSERSLHCEPHYAGGHFCVGIVGQAKSTNVSLLSEVIFEKYMRFVGRVDMVGKNARCKIYVPFPRKRQGFTVEHLLSYDPPVFVLKVVFFAWCGGL